MMYFDGFLTDFDKRGVAELHLVELYTYIKFHVHLYFNLVTGFCEKLNERF